MRILFIGGTGTISSSCLASCLKAGWNITILCRGNREERIPKGIPVIKGNAYQLDPTQEKLLVNTDWDCVVNWAIYEENHAHLDILRFAKNIGRYFFISSTSVYDGSNGINLISESQNYLNSKWYYSKSKIEAEKIFLSAYKTSNFPVTIIRPGHTYNDFTVPTNVQGLGYGLIKRIEQNKTVLLHDEGESYWTLTHSDDFAQAFISLLSNKENLAGEILHLTSHEKYTWNQIFAIYAGLLDKNIHQFYMNSEKIFEKNPVIGDPIVSDKRYNRIFNLKKLNKYAPNFKPSISLNDGLERVLRWHKNNEKFYRPNHAIEIELEKLGI